MLWTKHVHIYIHILHTTTMIAPTWSMDRLDVIYALTGETLMQIQTSCKSISDVHKAQWIVPLATPSSSVWLMVGETSRRC